MRGTLLLGLLVVALLPRVARAQGPDEKPKAEESAPPKAEPKREEDSTSKPPEKVDESMPQEGDKPKAKESTPPPKEESPAYGHGRQFGIRGGIVGGYRMIFRYDKSPYCSKPDPAKQLKDQQKFCGHGGPLAAEVALSFAPLDAVEPFLFGRFGLGREKQTDTDSLLMFGVGLRIYTMSDSAFKIFIEPAIGTELEGGGDDPLWKANEPDYKKDVIFHLAAGPQYDFAKFLGVFVDAGMTTGILRSIHSNLELQGGLQLRAP